jgi:hypothetical protein
MKSPYIHRLLVLVLAGAVSHLAGADDAKKEALRRAQALAACASQYSSAIARCRGSASAVACYATADQADLACRNVEGAAGHSDVPEPNMLTPPRPAPVGPNAVKRQLNCQTGLLRATGCADGHAGVPSCGNSSQEDINAGQGISQPAPGVVVDASGITDRCSNGTRMGCHDGFAVSPREGVDLCWDSSGNRDRYRY